jgi:potassium-transporting ATPase ATP-binding subunit
MPDGSIGEVSSTAFRKGDLVKVAIGEMIPADGEVTAGVASVDESASRF